MTNIRRAVGVLRALSAIGVGLAIAGCDDPTTSIHRVNSLSEAGSYHVSVAATIPFDEAVKKALAVKYDLTSAKAKEAVVPTTTYVEERLLDAFTGALGVGLGSTTQAGTRTVTDKEGTQTVSGTSTQTTNVGTAPNPPAAPGGLPATSRASAEVTTANDNKRTIAKDPILEYNLATALYQEVKLLELYVDNIEQRSNTKAYILRLNVSLQPHARNQPYDAYVSMGFFYESAFTPNPTVDDPVPLVVPLFVTDNLEGARTNRVAQMITQLSAAVSGIVNNAGFLGSLGFTRDRINGHLGTDLNSLLTVSRMTDNTIRIRLGAPLQGTTRFAMVPRNHTVSVLVLPSTAAARLVIHTKTSLRDVENGAVVPSNVPQQYAEARKVIARLFANNPRAIERLSSSTQIDRLMHAIQSNEIGKFRTTVDDANGAQYLYWQSLWIALSETSASSDFQSVTVSLSKAPPLPSGSDQYHPLVLTRTSVDTVRPASRARPPGPDR